MSPISLLQHQALGSIETAQKISRRVAQEVPAYKKFLADHQVSSQTKYDLLPFVDKTNYLKQYPFEELVGEDFAQTFNIFSSSGSSGRAFYWPQLKTSHSASEARLRQFLESTFAIHQRRTLVIVGLALGSWIGGDFLSWLLKSIAIDTSYPFATFSPGNKHDEIISILRSASPFVDQFILACCPSAIGHLILRAEQAGTPLPLEKMRYLTLGEPFPENLRTALEQNTQTPADETLMLSVYGSADTGVLGAESRASITLRKLALANSCIAEELGLDHVIPHFFHQADPDAYLETINGELCITKWQGIPLVRYNLHDNARLYHWPDIAARFPDWAQRYPELAPTLQQLSNMAPLALPGLIAITGRSDSCLILCGTNITESMFDEAVRTPDLAHILTGTYHAGIVLENGRQRLALTLEYHPYRGSSGELIDVIYPKLIQALGRVQPEFHDDWTNIYQTWDNDPEQRILKLDLVPWPAMSSNLEGKIKQRGVVA